MFDNDVIPDRRSPLAAARLAASTVWSHDAARSVGEKVRRFRPDVVHFHNTFPLVSPAAYSAGRAEGAGVVQTLHNYRLLCPNALMFRDGHPCEDCLGRTPPWPGIVHACYRGSRSQTTVAAAMLTFHRLRRTWERDVDVYVALTEFSKQKFVAGGLPPDRIVVKPNFLDPDPGGKTAAGDYFLFIGRLVQYKGVETLLQAWNGGGQPAPLHIVGDGPLSPTVTRAASEHARITYLGQMPRTSVLQQLRSCRSLVFPSLLYENFPVTVVEAFGCSVPVIAARIGAVAELVEDGRTGILFEPGDPEDLIAKVRWAWEHPAEMQRMGREARREYEAKYTAEHNYQMLMNLYAQTVERRHG